MNKFQNAILAGRSVPDPVVCSLVDAVGTLPESEGGSQAAMRLAEAALESAINSYFALRDIDAFPYPGADPLIEASSEPLTRNFFVYEVLANEELSDECGLTEIAHLTGEGPFLGSFGHRFSRRVSVPEMAGALCAAGSDSNWFDLHGEIE